jgi:dolichol-phosphate mannosyltransferase
LDIISLYERGVKLKLGIAIPTYNEVSNIAKLIEEIHQNVSNIPGLQTILLVIDDSSPDGTADSVKKLSKKYHSEKFKVLLHSRKVKNGLGRAYIEGFKVLLKLEVDYIIQMDADLSHNPVYMPAFIKASKKNELVVGSRYIPGGETPDWSFSRRFLSKSGNLYARTILGSKVSDYTGGYNMYSSKLIKSIGLDDIQSTGYGFLIELKYKASKKANSTFQVPIIFNDRQHGKSKMATKDTIIKNLVLVPKLKRNVKIAD